jgi:hypothetical protein
MLKHFIRNKNATIIPASLLKSLRNKNLKNLANKGTKGRSIPIDIREELDAETFVKEYLRKNKPVVLRGAAKEWACVKNWTPDFLDKRYGEDTIPIIDASPDTNEEIQYTHKEVKFKEVIAGMKKGDNDLYSRFNDLLGNHTELRDDIDMNWFLKRREKIVSGKVFQCFIGGATTYTHIHSAIQSNFFVEVFGKKRWLLFPPSYNQYLAPVVEGRPYFSTLFHPLKPNYDKFPEMEYLDFYDTTLEPGDILYNPPSWWHHVENETMTIGVGFRWTSLTATLKASPIQLLLTLTAYNPTIIFAINARGRFAEVFTFNKDKK